MSRTAYTREIEVAALKYGLDPRLVEAQVVVESAGHADAFRVEMAFFESYMKGKPEWAYTLDNPRPYAASYGLMQCLYAVAVELGFHPLEPPEHLFVPATNLEFGCRKLAELVAWANGPAFTGDASMRLHAALAAFNGGKRGNAPDEFPDRNARYADAILTIYARTR